ncbi:4Fe-4S dicluster domain-containing protein [Treponema brennaborense]|uniref:4Fe-4S ferredoxin iron-sulfur binding domain-containing protein n=1 Tax=Treponema brennaborense (strain DSM 12168 / CIP 105900 / DD5/3) TaxID=906968 RepID=F4LJR7_TREBD|nr:4Fe-4S dicluster domain-containing protein [Treponema brennaborense]AEE17447.1 4Fe-4S ferredoxin iron-sulfur binding domain-containing protein [Treponema brennaborense DSM 12168]
MYETINAALLAKAKDMLASGSVARVLGWQKGLFNYDITPAVFSSAEELGREFVYNEFCGANMSKYLIKESRKEGKILVFLKPCDTYSFNQLIKEHRIIRENVYAVGVPCNGMKDPESGETAERCLVCRGKKHVAYDELLSADGVSCDESELDAETAKKRFAKVAELEALSPDERFEFWRGELSRCIRCNACRNVCPACSCELCVFDNPGSGVANKAPSDSFEENMFHIIRAFHVAGRCTDCGECSRVCPQHIPLHLLNRKFIKDIDELYGDYQAGADTESRAPLNTYTTGDVEPSVVYERSSEKGGND